MTENKFEGDFTSLMSWALGDAITQLTNEMRELHPSVPRSTIIDMATAVMSAPMPSDLLKAIVERSEEIGAEN